MPLNVVVDASVLVSAFLFPDSVPGRIVALANRSRFALHLLLLLLDETQHALLSRRLKKSYSIDQQVVSAWRTKLKQIVNVRTGALPEIGAVCRDPNDDHVIAAAVAVGATVIVAGDKDLLALSQFEAVRMLTARAFITELEHC